MRFNALELAMFGLSVDIPELKSNSIGEGLGCVIFVAAQVVPSLTRGHKRPNGSRVLTN